MTSRRLSFSARFASDFKKLRKRYRNIDSDVRPLTERLKAGETPGDQIAGTGYTVYKVRLSNSDAQRGKSGGYRVIYYLQLADHVILLTIYSKSDQTDIPADTIHRLIEDLELP
jgi:mRNA-degrading endonuclease RelE of RelBE toxin-antitoxin system